MNISISTSEKTEQKCILKSANTVNSSGALFLTNILFGISAAKQLWSHKNVPHHNTFLCPTKPQYPGQTNIILYYQLSGPQYRQGFVMRAEFIYMFSNLKKYIFAPSKKISTSNNIVLFNNN